APYNTANTEASAEKYDCIFNLVNANDFIPMLPIADWGFTRYGRTASLDGSAYAAEIKSRTGTDYSGKYLTASDMSTLLGKFVCITGENADRNNPGKILGWREVYVYHCGHEHPGETVGNYQSTTFRAKGGGFIGIGGFTESEYNGYADRLRKYSYWKDGACETPAYCLQVLVELLVEVAKGNTLSGGWDYLTSNKLADKYDFNKQSLISYATKLTEPHFMDTYSVIQSKLGEMADPGSLFVTLPGYAENGRPVHSHSYTYVPYAGQEPSCTEEGLGYRYCLCSQVNGDYYDDYQKNVPIPALGHQPGEPQTENVIAPGCVQEGSHELAIYCGVCGEELSRETLTDPAPGHSWGDWTVTQPPACTSAGTKERLCLVCGETETEVLAPICPGEIFTDMPARDHWAHQAIDWAVSREITAGTSETSFSPNAACTRAQVVTLLWRAAGKPDSTIDLAFDDVPGPSWYAQAVRWAVEQGITTGTGSGRFSPNQPCSRAQAVCFLYRFAQASPPEDMENPFLDVPENSWFADAVRWAVNKGITTGTGEASFSPNVVVSRAQVVTLLYRALSDQS
ncbi:MAG: S-layer homology domain-containing protein, partial [Oscillospiraceae bacterium]|nr:S-layer homology domain-containing protein [Oscillospiraceae bacterium]